MPAIYRVGVNSIESPCELAVSKHGLTWWPAGESGKKHHVAADEVVSVHKTDMQDELAALLHLACRTKEGKRSGAVIKLFFFMADQFENFMNGFNNMIGRQTGGKVLVICNSAAHKVKKSNAFDSFLAPIMHQQNQIELELVETSQVEGRQLVRVPPSALCEYRAIVVLGGDGTLNRFLQQILRGQVFINDLPPISILPLGKINGVSESIAAARGDKQKDRVAHVMAALHGSKRNLDIHLMRQGMSTFPVICRIAFGNAFAVSQQGKVSSKLSNHLTAFSTKDMTCRILLRPVMAKNAAEFDEQDKGYHGIECPKGWIEFDGQFTGIIAYNVPVVNGFGTPLGRPQDKSDTLHSHSLEYIIVDGSLGFSARSSVLSAIMTGDLESVLRMKTKEGNPMVHSVHANDAIWIPTDSHSSVIADGEMCCFGPDSKLVMQNHATDGDFFDSQMVYGPMRISCLSSLVGDGLGTNLAVC